MSVRPVFMESVDFAERITEMYDFVWPTAAAMWNLRWQVQGFMAVNPKATKQTLRSRFVEGSGIRGENLERACIDYDWARQQEHFARIVLVNLFAHYESWCRAIRDRFVAPAEVEKDLQFWERTVDKKVRRFVDAVQLLATRSSPTMATAFQSEYQKSDRYAGPHLEAMLKCLRAFKELRNCIAHQGAETSARLVAAYDDWQPFATPSHMGTKEVPRFVKPILGSPCVVDLRGVVGFSKILLAIVETVDADLAGTIEAEDELVARWRRRGGTVRLKPSKSFADFQIHRAVGHIGMLKPVITAELLVLLRSHRLVA